jgi:hypothetical protein
VIIVLIRGRRPRVAGECRRRAEAEVRMSEATYDVGAPEPKPIDEELSVKLGHLAEDAILRGKPNGDERCGNCLYYLDTDKDISYCWHPKLRILVGDPWWCQWWEEIEES